MALPLCLGISLASGAPLYSGLLAGVIGGMIIPLISKSTLSVSGPAAGLTAICAMAIVSLGSVEKFFLSVAIAGLLQILLGVLRLGGFTHFIPSAVIKGMLAAIGIILIFKQMPLIIGYDKPDFWKEELFNLITFRGFDMSGLSEKVSAGAILIACFSLLFLIAWKKWMAPRLVFLPTSFVTVLAGALLAFVFQKYVPALSLTSSQFVLLPADGFAEPKIPEFSALFSNSQIWKSAVVIGLVATLETLLSIEAIDKLDPSNRITPQNRELVAQGFANFASGVLGGLPITSVIVRSAANAEAGAKTRLSAFLHGVWLLLTALFAASLVQFIPYCVLAVILMRTGYNLARPAMIIGVYKQGREQFLPFVVTIAAILSTDLLIGVVIGVAYAIYFLVKHTYRAGYTVQERQDGSIRQFTIDLALNVSFLNKKRFMELLERIPEHSLVEINGTRSVYIDHDVLEILHAFKVKAADRHIQLVVKGLPETEVIAIH
ncbi:SulP family inorganic anion transporter [Chryseolinea sp. Jin1]|uniref:SulP family inorganic anion transporter n=1 Tax=Chryseolinea lacunae TaxID=2801331 RepID=A0ABS1KMK2_9BACT|nr:SulP family inorganic anion transporter [Chryseolinea lacunae]